MHKLLLEQINAHFGSADNMPEELTSFLDAINEVYLQSDKDRALLEQSIQLSSSGPEETPQLPQDELEELTKIGDTLLIRAEQSRLLLESSPLPTVFYDNQGSVQYVNPAFSDVFGWTNQELHGQRINFVPEEDQQSTNEAIAHSIKTGRLINFLTRRTTKDGQILHVQINAAAIYDEQGNFTGSIVNLHDITDRIEMEQELRHSLQRRSSQVQISTQIAQEIAAAKDMADLYKRTVSLVNENFNFYHTQLLRYNPTSNNVALVAGYGEVGSKMLAAGYQVSLGDGPIGRAAATKSSSLITDFTESSLWTPNPLIPHAQSELASPIKLGDQVLGILDVVHDAPNAIDADTQLVIEVICGQIAVAIESMRLRTEMEERLRELDTLQTITSGEGWKSFREYSEDLTHGYIYDPVEAQPVKFEDATHQLPAASGRDSFVKSLQVRGETIGSLGILSDPDRPLEEDEIDLLEAISTQVAEALERARLFEQSQRSASELSVLNKMGNAFTESLDEKAIIENILVYASQLIDTTNFYVSFYNEPENEISFPLVIEDGQRLTPGHPGWVNWQPRQAGEGLTEHIIHTRQPILLQDNPVDRLADMGVHYIQHGSDTQSWLGVPLTIGDRILGTLAAQSDTTPRLYTARHLDLLTAVASQAAIALENARLFHQVQSRAEQERLVRTITDRVRRGGDTKAILRITMEELNQALKTKKSGIRLGTAEQLINSFSFPNQEPQSAQDTPSSEVE